MRKRAMAILLMYLLFFTIILSLAVYDLKFKIAFFDIGLSATITNIIVVAMSFLGLIKTIWHIYTF